MEQSSVFGKVKGHPYLERSKVKGQRAKVIFHIWTIHPYMERSKVNTKGQRSNDIFHIWTILPYMVPQRSKVKGQLKGQRSSAIYGLFFLIWQPWVKGHFWIRTPTALYYYCSVRTKMHYRMNHVNFRPASDTGFVLLA